ncbi:MAG TPA: nuclear transport factor 2 family protein [Acidimicrobiales bacterium]|nr:nuclear transport factor 2 family protein [Acidimicrobiales bacterium]
MAATAEQIRATIDAYVAAFTNGDKDGYLSLFAPDGTVEDPVGSEVCRGPAEIAGFWDGVRNMTPTIELRLVGTPRVAGGGAAFAMQALPELGDAKMVVDIIDVMAFDDEGRITSLRAYWDMAEMRPYDG